MYSICAIISVTFSWYSWMDVVFQMGLDNQIHLDPGPSVHTVQPLLTEWDHFLKTAPQSKLKAD